MPRSGQPQSRSAAPALRSECTHQPPLRACVGRAPRCLEVATSTARHRRRAPSTRSRAHISTARPPQNPSAARALRSERTDLPHHFTCGGRVRWTQVSKRSQHGRLLEDYARRAGHAAPGRGAGPRALGRPARPAARPAALPSGTWVPGAICSTGAAIPAEVTK